jgi:hypothetical protein
MSNNKENYLITEDATMTAFGYSESASPVADSSKSQCKCAKGCSCGK